jgi:hypothetical protein
MAHSWPHLAHDTIWRMFTGFELHLVHNLMSRIMCVYVCVMKNTKYIFASKGTQAVYLNLQCVSYINAFAKHNKAYYLLILRCLTNLKSALIVCYFKIWSSLL